jgi:hypothetical protein
MANTFFILVGVTCAAIAALIIYGVAAAIHRRIKELYREKHFNTKEGGN